MTTPVARVLAALGPLGVRRCGKGWIARCPVHGDRHASLAVAEGDHGGAVLKCHGGCETAEVIRAVGLEWRDLFPSSGRLRRDGWVTYDYRDEGGRLLFQVIRIRVPDGKRFAQRRPDGADGWLWTVEGVRRVLYRLPELLAADPARPVFIVEGEKDADKLARLGLVATTNPGGAGKWRPDYGTVLRRRHVVILPDNDRAGFLHAAHVTRMLRGIVASVRVVRLPGLAEHGDASDWLSAGGTVAALHELARSIPPIGRARAVEGRAHD